jgi:hypothetical protein
MKNIIMPSAFLVFFTLMISAAFPQEVIHDVKNFPNHTLVRKYSNLKNAPEQSMINRIASYPTQIVRTEGKLKNSNYNCNEVFQMIDDFFNNHISNQLFFYNTINYCSYDPKTQLATKFIINSYFDPINDNAIVYLKKYLDEHQGKDLLGTTFNVESAQALIVSLNIDAGIEDVQDPNTFFRIKQDHASHYFASNYDMRINLIKDVRQQFFSNQARIVLPFMTKWFITSRLIYESALSKSNYVELRPELIFVMDKSPKIFTPLLRLYYSHHCSKYANQHCL